AQSVTPELAQTPRPPYFAVIFTSIRSDVDEGYETTAARMVELVEQQPGFLGYESSRGADGLGTTISYWRSLDDVARWKHVVDHREVLLRERTERLHDPRAGSLRAAFDREFPCAFAAVAAEQDAGAAVTAVRLHEQRLALRSHPRQQVDRHAVGTARVGCFD